MDIVTKFVQLIEFEDSRLNTRCDNLSRRIVKQNEETNEKSTKLSIQFQDAQALSETTFNDYLKSELFFKTIQSKLQPTLLRECERTIDDRLNLSKPQQSES